MIVLLLSFAVALADQFIKYLVREHFGLHESVPVLAGLFHLTYVRNMGAAWGIFGGWNAWLALLSIVMLILIVCFRRSFLSDHVAQRIALGLMLGGIVGNLVDRIRLFFVVDFFDFFWGQHHFPAFNIADAAICTGVFLYILSSMWLSARPREPSASA